MQGPDVGRSTGQSSSITIKNKKATAETLIEQPQLSSER